MVTRRKLLRGGMTIAGIGGLAGCVGGFNDSNDGENYPSDTITFMVPAGPGGGSDTYARTFSTELSTAFDVPVQVRNEPGAGQWLALGTIVSEEPNGYTIGTAVMPGAQTNAMIEEPDVDIDAIGFACGIAQSPSIIVADPNLTQYENDLETMFNGVRDGEHTDIGVVEGGGVHIAAALVRERLDVPFTEIGYDSSTESNAAVARGEVPFSITTVEGALDLVEEGTVIPVGNLTSERSEAFPDTPSLVEDLGAESIDFVANTTRPIIVHDDTPQERVDLLEETFESIINSDQIQDWSESSGFNVTFMDQEEITDLWNTAFEVIPEEVNLDEISG